MNVSGGMLLLFAVLGILILWGMVSYFLKMGVERKKREKAAQIRATTENAKEQYSKTKNWSRTFWGPCILQNHKLKKHKDGKFVLGVFLSEPKIRFTLIVVEDDRYDIDIYELELWSSDILEVRRTEYGDHTLITTTFRDFRPIVVLDEDREIFFCLKTFLKAEIFRHNEAKVNPLRMR